MPRMIDLLSVEPALSSALCRAWPQLRAADVGAEAIESTDVVVLPHILPATLRPNLESLRSVLQSLPAAVERLVVVSSTAIYPPLPSHPGMVEESAHHREPRHEVAAEWAKYEALVAEEIGKRDVDWLMLRAAPTPVCGAGDFVSACFELGTARLPWGFDPSWQLLSVEDLASAVRRSFERLSQRRPRSATESSSSGAGEAPRVFNIAAAPVPRDESFRRAGNKPRTRASSLLRLGRRRRGLPVAELDYLCYPFTCSTSLARDELGFQPGSTSAQVAAALQTASRVTVESVVSDDDADPGDFDPFGMDPAFIQRLGGTAFRFMHDGLWRVEIEGVEGVPKEGRAVIAGIHRGFFPFDAMMALHGVTQHRGRTPRFLIHPVLLRWPGSSRVITKLGGMVACQENAAHVLESDELLGIFPEGVRGGFSYYRDAYRVQRFGRDEFVRMALRHRAPIVPFVTVGSAEVFPVLAKVNWRWWRQLSGWPCLPITPTFPFLPVPLPAKWHTWFLEPLAVQEHHPPEAADDRQLVRQISAEVARRMTEAMAQIRRQRPSIFWGNVFDEDFRRRSEEWMSSDQRWRGKTAGKAALSPETSSSGASH